MTEKTGLLASDNVRESLQFRYSDQSDMTRDDGLKVIRNGDDGATPKFDGFPGKLEDL